METREQVLQRPPVWEGGIAYSLAALLTLLFGVLASVIVGLAGAAESAQGADWYKYISYLLPQAASAAACAVYFRRSKRPLRRVYRMAKWRYFAVAVLLQFGLLFSLNFLNGYFVKFLELFGYHASMESSVPTLTGWNLLPAILVIALLPAILEETLFRGAVFGSMEESGWGTFSAVLVSGALFSLFHGNPEQTIYQFLCGAAFALLAQRAGSLLPGMLAHFLNNAVILSLTSFGVEIEALPLAGTIALYVVSGVCLAGTLAFLFLEKKNVRGGVKEGKQFFLAASVGILVCAVEWFVALAGGFSA